MHIEYGIDLALHQLGYQPGNQDKIVFNAQSELNMYTTNAKDAMKIWGWDPEALRPEDHYRIDQLLRMYVFQRDQILAALKRVDGELPGSQEAEQQLADFKAFLSKEMRRVRGLTSYKEDLTEEEKENWHTAIDVWHEEQRERGSQEEFPAVAGVVAFQHPAVSRYLGKIPSLAMGGYTGGGGYFRLTDNGYPREWIEDGGLYDLIDMAMALQAELQLQCLLVDREFTRIVATRGQEFAYLKAEAARKAAEESTSFWATFGDIMGIVSAVAGVLALIPVLTPIAGPVAAVAALESLGAHTVDAVVKNKWDEMTVVGLGADALAALPGVGAVAKSLKAGRAGMKLIGTGAKAMSKAKVFTATAGREFLGVTGGAGKGAKAIAEAAEASKVFDYIGTKGAKLVKASAASGKKAGKFLQGSVNLATQVPLVVEMSSGSDMSTPKDAAAGTALTANFGQSIGSWGVVGDAAKKGGTLSIAVFSKIIGRR
ncbi:hypothetical protein K7472_04750 [Streptomyces sp. PTM05]|uniref:Pre-toxin TG domain-containing protein n=1 Tax=Streptantibioticus parmotrematis TaxID=2873249 RepID=A0ABS7QLZ2_9ACTN|nr:hypothetical protein [Streptantibioticus parmotrematis]MBY8884155.1 hypothetical protein [Streptantibioticus parmotrematis]